MTHQLESWLWAAGALLTPIAVLLRVIRQIVRDLLVITTDLRKMRHVLCPAALCRRPRKRARRTKKK